MIRCRQNWLAALRRSEKKRPVWNPSYGALRGLRRASYETQHGQQSTIPTDKLATLRGRWRLPRAVNCLEIAACIKAMYKSKSDGHVTPYTRADKSTMQLRSNSSSLCVVLVAVVLSAAFAVCAADSTASDAFSFEFPKVLLKGKSVTTVLDIDSPYVNGTRWPALVNYTISGFHKGEWDTIIQGNTTIFDPQGSMILSQALPSFTLPGRFGPGSHHFKMDIVFASNVTLTALKKKFVIPAWTTILPPLVTLVIAFVFRQVLLSLLLGVFMGSFLLEKYNPLNALLRTFDTYFVGAFTDYDHAAVLLFTFLLGGLIGVVQRSGGTEALARICNRVTHTPQRALVATWIMGVLIFFDDYSSILIVGNSLRSVVERVGVSPYYFAYILQSMGPSLASFAPVSSWVGVELGYISSQYKALGRDDDPFVVLLKTIPYRFIPLLMPLLAILIISLRRPIGPLKKYAKAHPVSTGDAGARNIQDEESGDITVRFEPIVDNLDNKPELGPMDPRPDQPRRWLNAAIPFLTVIICTFAGMYLNGRASLPDGVPATLLNVFEHADSVKSLLWASMAGWLIAMFLVVVQRICSLEDSMTAWMAGVKDVIDPCFILLLAWALGAVIHDVQTAQFLVSGLQAGLPAGVLPALTLALASVMSFGTGSAFGTMGIIFPLVLPLAAELAHTEAEVSSLLIQCQGAIFAGSVFGNYCSPIADDMVLTSLAARCELTQHVKVMTLPAALVALCSLLLGSLPLGFDAYPLWCAWLLSVAVLVGSLFILGRKSGNVEVHSDGEVKPLLHRE